MISDEGVRGGDMLAFIISGIVYLVGVAILLVLRPSYMFTPDGDWKEFGIGKDDRYTPFPFWLFCITWALVAYVLVIVALGKTAGPSPLAVNSAPMYDSGEAVELPKGYYVLNKKATKLSGVPKYVYLGPEPLETTGQVPEFD